MNETPTPRTDEAWAAWPYAGSGMSVHVGRELERELTAVTEQRDRLAKALRKFVGDALFCSHTDTATDVLPHQKTGSAQNGVTMP